MWTPSSAVQPTGIWNPVNQAIKDNKTKPNNNGIKPEINLESIEFKFIVKQT
jgi:hypothetical protein